MRFQIDDDCLVRGRELMLSSTSTPPKSEIGFHTLRSGAEPSEKALARRP